MGRLKINSWSISSRYDWQKLLPIQDQNRDTSTLQVWYSIMSITLSNYFRQYEKSGYHIDIKHASTITHGSFYLLIFLSLLTIKSKYGNEHKLLWKINRRVCTHSLLGSFLQVSGCPCIVRTLDSLQGSLGTLRLLTFLLWQRIPKPCFRKSFYFSLWEAPAIAAEIRKAILESVPFYKGHHSHSDTMA